MQLKMKGNNLDNVYTWINNNRLGDNSKLPCFWRLYHIRSINGSYSRSTPLIQTNYEHEDITNSFELLDSSCQALAYVRTFCIVLVKSKDDSKGAVRNFSNPYYGTDAGGSGISGTNVQSGFNHFQMFELFSKSQEMQLQHLEMQYQNKLDDLKKEHRYEKKIDSLKDEIAGLQQANKSFFSEIISELKEPLFMFINSRMAQPEQQTPPPAKIQQPEQKSDNNDKYKTIEPALSELEKYNHFNSLLGELAVLCKFDKTTLFEVHKIINQKAVNIQAEQIKNKSNE